MKSALFACLFVGLSLSLTAAETNRTAASPIPKQNWLSTPDTPSPLTLMPALDYDTDGYNASDVAVADLNGDGNADLVVTSWCESGTSCSHGVVSVLMGNGDGTFQPPVVYNSGGSYAVSVTITDLNGDGHPDLVVVNNSVLSGNFGPGAVSVFLNDGHGGFHSPVVYNSGGSTSGLGFYQWAGVADVNADGKPDILVANQCIGNCVHGGIGVLLGNGDGTFMPVVTYDAGNYLANSAALADVNGDGKLDLVVSTAGGNGEINVLLGNGDGTFQTATSQAVNLGDFSIASADLNGDGKVDLVAGSGTGVSVLLGNGNGTFKTPVDYPIPENDSFPVAVGDVNGDGIADLVVPSECVGVVCDNLVGGVSVLLGKGDGTFQQAATYNSGGYYATFTAIGDVNGDGMPDLLVTNMQTLSGVAVLLNNDGAPPTTTTLTSSINPVPPGKAVTFTATVASQAGGALNGNVIFHDNGPTVATVPLANNTAAFTTSYSQNGTQAVTAVYSGALHTDAGSQSDPLTECIPPASKTVVTTSGSPSLAGTPVTFTATVKPKSGTVPDGEPVNFYSGTTFLSSVPLAGDVAAYTTSTLSGTTHVIHAVYSGDCAIGPSKGSVTQVVELYSSTTTLHSSPNPSNVGQSVALNATVTSGAPGGATGKVTFKNGTTTLGTALLNAGKTTLNTTKLPAGTDTITANYAGDAKSGKSSGTTTQTVH